MVNPLLDLPFLLFLYFGCAGANNCSLKIHPATVVVRHGDPVTVNCSVNNTDHEGMGWVAQQGSVGLTEDVQFLLWSVRNLTAWDIKPQCYANVRNSPTQCTDQVSVTMYKPADSISITTTGHTGLMVEGNQYRLVCEIQNIAPVQMLTVRWYKGSSQVNETRFTNNIKSPVNVSTDLLISPSRKDDGVTYRCEAELDLGPEGPQTPIKATSDSLNTPVIYGPRISQCPVSMQIMEGESLKSIGCRADGNPPPDLIWERNGEKINDSTPLMRMDEGEYLFIAVNNISSAEHKLHITVEYAPELYCDEHYIVVENQTLDISCTAKGSPQPENSWWKDGKKVNLPTTFNWADGGMYNFTSWNRHGSVAQTLHINVLYGPRISHCPVSTQIKEGESLEFIGCRADGNPPPELIWEKNGKKVNVSTPQIRMDEGEYLLTAVNNISSAEHKLHITVEYAPELYCDDQYVLVENQTLDISCIAKGSPQPENSWWKDGKKVNLPTTFSRADGGMYNFTSWNRHGSVAQTLHINVLYKPRAKQPHENVIVNQGETFSLNCSMEGNPHPMFWWSSPAERNGSRVEGNFSRVISKASEAHGGVYICCALNSQGKACKKFTVTVRAVPLRIAPILVISLLLVLIVLIVIACAIHRKRVCGEYSLISHKQKERKQDDTQEKTENFEMAAKKE